MRQNKFITTWKIVLSVLCAIFLSCAICAYALTGKPTQAITGSTASVGALYDFDKHCYNEQSLNDLAKRLLGNTATFNDLIKKANDAGTMGEPLTNKEATVEYGRFRSSQQGQPRSLVWLPVYISRSISGQAVLTLYLASTANSVSSVSTQEISYFSYNRTYSESPNIEAPTNSYGTSHLRAVTLGNLDKYAQYNNTHTGLQQMYNAQTLGISSVHKFSDFTSIIDGKQGLLAEDIVTPSEMAWQATENAMDYIDSSRTYSKYTWPNEAYGAPASPNYYQPNYFDYSSNEGGKNKTNYDIWKNDKVWLPSLTEVGTGDVDGDGAGIKDGIWQLTKYQRSNTVASWLRTACTTDAKSGTGSSKYSTYTMFGTAANGDITTLDVSSSSRYGVRPAIHLNLSQIADKTTAPINLPETGVRATYNGEAHVISPTKTTVPEDQLAGWWRADGSMIVSFYSDETLNQGLAPENAGTYWMLVELLDSDLNFFGEPSSTRSKGIPFIIEKIKLNVSWTYDTANNNTPTSVTYDKSQLLQPDLISGNIPEIAMMYSNILGVGIKDGKEFPDQKGTYRATAYIIDDDTYNYNYELSDANKVSEEFTVKEKPIAEPYFVEAGEGSKELELSYKGRQYVQIANVSQYVEIIVTAKGTDDAITAVATEKLKDLGVVNNVQTFIVETVADYTFTARLKDTMNTQWASSTENNKDVTDRVLKLAVARAQITVTFDGLPSSWDTSTEMSFNLAVLGVYDDSDINMRVYYNTPSGSAINIEKSTTTGRYVIPRGLAAGENYSIVAVMNNQNTSNYYMESAKRQKFTIVKTVAEFGTAKANWVYVIGNTVSTNTAGGYADHNTPEKALEVNNVDDYYKFSLNRTESTLKNDNLKATYSGDTFVKEAGLYSVTVVVSGYDKNVVFEEETYTIYFRIKKKVFNLSNVEWNYSGEAFTYSGSENKVMLDPDSLPAGLTASYLTTGNGIDAGQYTTLVKFKVADDNYEIPDAATAGSYIGASFSFTCDWEIVPQDIIVNWNTDNDLFIPTLRVGHSYVDYSFEHYVNNEWVTANKVYAETVDERYRVSATLKPEYSGNYTLVENRAQEFTVKSGKQPVTLGFTINDVAADNNEQFAYTGKPFAVKPVVDTAGVTITDFTVEYFPLNGAGIKGASLGAEAPVNVGKYAAVVTMNFEGGYLPDGSDTEIQFEIVKADMDISGLVWTYTYETKIGTTIAAVTVRAYWDVEQKRWIDEKGREVVFEFEYDGTEKKISIDGENTVPELFISEIKGNTGTTANTYTANIKYTWSDNYNQPEFPTTLTWVINKATVDLSDVKWGYVDDEGEHEFDFANDAFVYTRDENGEVPYTVALINIPSYIANNFTYKTLSQTSVNAKEEDGNSYAAIGSYVTRFIFTGEFQDANHNLFNSASIPSTLSSFVQWEIAERELTKPIYNNDWVIFDDKAHDLIDLCNMPESELFYFHVDITFIDTQNNIIKNYDGSNYFNGTSTVDLGGKYFARDAGTYIVDFYQIMEIDGKPADIFWARAEIVVEMAELEVTWDRMGSYPVARVKGVAVSEIIGTRYTSASGNEVTIATIQAANGITFYATPYVTSSFAKNLKFKMAEHEDIRLEFKSYYFEMNELSVRIPYPEFIEDELEYTGNKLTFTIKNWYQTYENYIYISDGDLYDSERGEVYATDMGEYFIAVSFKGDANAYWSGTEGNRSAYIIHFKVVKPTKMAIEYPELNTYSVTYTGTPIEFIITNWLVLADYLEYEVFYMGVSQGTNLKQTAAGFYTIKFNFMDDSIGYWGADPDNPKKEYSVQFEIRDPNEEVRELFNPTFTTSNTTVEATGSEITFYIKDWATTYAQYVNIICEDERVTINQENGSVSASKVATYSIILSIKEGYNIVFADGETESLLTFKITPSGTTGGELDKPKFKNDTETYTGNALSFRIEDWDSIYSKLIEFISYDDGVTISANGTVSAVNVGTYKVVLGFKEDVKNSWTWAGEGGNDNITLSFTITASSTVDEPEKITIPTLTFTEKEFTGKPIIFTIADWDKIKKYVTIVEGENALAVTDAGPYKITLRLKDTKLAVWVDASGKIITADQPLSFIVKKAVIDIDNITMGDDGKIIIKNGDDEVVNIDDYLEYDYFYVDENGQEVHVKADELEEGREYKVNVSVKQDKLNEFNKNVDNASGIRQEFENNTYIIKYTLAAGTNWKLIIIIGSIAFVVLLLLVLIIVIAIRKRNSAYYDDDYDDGYYEDDYDDYDDDYDEYDDEY